jgi:hypothetical protein
LMFFFLRDLIYLVYIFVSYILLIFFKRYIKIIFLGEKMHFNVKLIK